MQQQQLNWSSRELHRCRHGSFHLPATTDRAACRQRRCVRPAAAAASEAPPRPRLVLGIESSCDDTGVAVVTSDGRVLGESLATQAEIHAPWGGVVPNLAMDAHKAAIDRVVSEALERAGVRPEQLDAVAVTVGPGLGLCLRVGVLKALQLSSAHHLPLIRVHHMEAHALVARMAPDMEQRPAFPFLCLLVSGGHNLLLLVRGVGQYVQLGTTLDDALGEAYDKVARLLGLDLRPSGGAALEALARQGNPLAYKFVVPMRKYSNCDFSYAGLKTSTRLAITAHLGGPQDSPPGTQQGQATPATAPPAATEATAAGASNAAHETQGVATAAVQAQHAPGDSSGQGDASSSHTDEEAARKEKIKADIAASFQHVATMHLVERVTRATAWAKESDPSVRHLVVAGGVACNQHIRTQLGEVAAKAGLTLVLPPPRWCTDNGAMVAWAGQERMELGLVEPPHALEPGEQITDDTWVDLWPRWPLTSTKHTRCETAVATTPNIKAETVAQYGQRSARKARLHTSLTDMTAMELSKRAAGADV